MKQILIATIATLSFNLAQAVQVEGVNFEDKTTVGSSDLIVNGTGVRSKFGKRYVMALYLPAKAADLNAVLASTGPKRISINLLKDVSGKTFANALIDGIKNNSTSEEIAVLKDSIKQWSDTVIALDEVKAGSTVQIDFIPEAGTRLSINGETKGKDIPGQEFYKALLKVWLGNDPIQADLKKGLLGKTS